MNIYVELTIEKVSRDSKCPVFLEFQLPLGVGNVPEPLALSNFMFIIWSGRDYR